MGTGSAVSVVDAQKRQRANHLASPDSLRLRRQAAEAAGWLIRPGMGARCMVAERGDFKRFQRDLHELLLDLESSSRPRPTLPTLGTPGRGYPRGDRGRLVPDKATRAKRLAKRRVLP